MLQKNEFFMGHFIYARLGHLNYESIILHIYHCLVTDEIGRPNKPMQKNAYCSNSCIALILLLYDIASFALQKCSVVMLYVSACMCMFAFLGACLSERFRSGITEIAKCDVLYLYHHEQYFDQLLHHISRRLLNFEIRCRYLKVSCTQFYVCQICISFRVDQRRTNI